MMSDDHRRGCVGVGGEARQPPDEVFPAAQIHARGRLVEQQQLWVAHQGARDLHPLALPLAQRAERPVGEMGHTQAVQQSGGSSYVQAARTPHATGPVPSTRR